MDKVTILKSNWTKTGSLYSQQKADRFFNQLYPDEIHGLPGDCINPKCDAVWGEPEIKEMEAHGGWIECPECHTIQNPERDGYYRTNRVGLTPTAMGQIGEKIIENLGTIPLLGKITWIADQYQFPIDMIAGDYGVEIKTNHSESQPRFKMGGGNNPDISSTRAGKYQYCEQNNLRPALVGVRLNFYTDKADIFVRPDSFSDSWIGVPGFHHVAQVDFSELNPFKHPEDVPPPSQLPFGDDSDIPF